jgi:hypothetical protein
MIGPHKNKSGVQGITEQLTGHKYGGEGHELPGHHGVADDISSSMHDEEGEMEEPDYLEHCAERIIDAVHAKDAEELADALREAFEELEEEPHEEGPHLED